MLSRFATCLLLAGSLSLPGALTGCTPADRQEVSAATENSYTDFKRFVEQMTADGHWHELHDEAFSVEMNRLKADYDAKVAAVDRDIDQYTAEQRAEIDTLKNRYTAAYEQRLAAHQRYQRGDTLAVAPAVNVYQPDRTAYASLSAAALRPAYEDFVRKIDADKNLYTAADWHAVEADWQALEARRATVATQLSTADRDEIAKERVKYRTLKSVYKAKNSEEARQLKEGARQVGQQLEKGARKVGVAAEGALQGARDALRKDRE